MMMKKGFLVAGVLLLASGSVFAEASKPIGVYYGGNVGWSNWDDDNGLSDSSSDDDTDVTWQVNAGYKFNKNFAVDARYTDLGEFDVSDDRFNITAWSVNAVGILPISDGGWEIFGQLGLGRANTDTRCCGGNNKEAMFTTGFGGRYSITRNFSMSLQADVYGYSTDSYDNLITALSFGMQYIFE